MSLLRRWRFFGARWADPSEANVPGAPAYETPALYPDGIVRWRLPDAGECVPEILVDDVSGEILFDDVTGDVLYDESSCVGGGGGGSTTMAGLADVALTSPADGDHLVFDGTDWVNQAPGTSTAEGQDTANVTTYVATTGNDTTGDGTSGNPYATVTKALSTLPRSIGFVQTIDVADGTYAETISLTGFTCTGAGKILITGNTTTPANVSFTGSASQTHRGRTYTACWHATGSVVVEFEGLRVNATTNIGAWFVEGARVTLDRCTITGTLSFGVFAAYGAYLDLTGNLTVSGWADRGFEILNHAEVVHSGSGITTVTGPGTSGWAIHIAINASWTVFDDQSDCDITITGVLYGFQLGFCAIFSLQSTSSTITVDNVTTPANSRAVLATDVSSWSTNQAFVVDHMKQVEEHNSNAYYEAVGSNTFTNIG